MRENIMDRAGHLLQIDKPEEFNATALDFLNA
jgi:pimeloyl-ACP methyl ester carboxylesterase